MVQIIRPNKDPVYLNFHNIYIPLVKTLNLNINDAGFKIKSTLTIDDYYLSYPRFSQYKNNEEGQEDFYLIFSKADEQSVKLSKMMFNSYVIFNE